jgi:ABC-type antimicrobial peptide transport system permease subunit
MKLQRDYAGYDYLGVDGVFPATLACCTLVVRHNLTLAGIPAGVDTANNMGTLEDEVVVEELVEGLAVSLDDNDG